MQRSSLRAAAIGVALLISMAGTAFANTKDYEFQLLDKDVKAGAAIHRSRRTPSCHYGRSHTAIQPLARNRPKNQGRGNS